MVEASDPKPADTPAKADAKAKDEAQEQEQPVDSVQVDILEEDDDFEEFKEDEWEDAALNADEHLEWEDNWDDEEDDDDFAKRLRAEVAANGAKA